MRRFRPFFLLWLCLLFGQPAFLQQPGPAGVREGKDLFDREAPLSLSLTASIKSLKRDTDDSNQLQGVLRFSEGTAAPDSIDVRMQARGDFRRTQCYFAPLKLIFRESDIKGTLFEGHEELKVVLPCQLGALSEDYVLKEYLAYKLFEVVSPYHYRTRLADITFTELKGRRERTHRLKGFLIEDHGTLARRVGGKRYRQNMPAQMQDPYYSVVNNLFQYAIGNTDFSLRIQHNQRLYYIDGAYFCIPYDFDMAGLVDASYATVSNVQTLKKPVYQVTDRAYKGYVRDTALVQQVRREFLRARPQMMRELQALEPLFAEPREYAEATAYLQRFFGILEDDRKFEREILRHMRE